MRPQVKIKQTAQGWTFAARYANGWAIVAKGGNDRMSEPRARCESFGDYDRLEITLRQPSGKAVCPNNRNVPYWIDDRDVTWAGDTMYFAPRSVLHDLHAEMLQRAEYQNQLSTRYLNAVRACIRAVKQPFGVMVDFVVEA